MGCKRRSGASKGQQQVVTGSASRPVHVAVSVLNWDQGYLTRRSEWVVGQEVRAQSSGGVQLRNRIPILILDWHKKKAKTGSWPD